MLVSFAWLKEFVDIDRSAEEIAEILTMGGIEVEGVNSVGQGLKGVLTARIEQISPHPKSDKLHLATLSLGDRMVVVVCGAPNTAVGQIVPYAPPGIVLPSGLEITQRDIKGVSSPGMLCSEKELGLTDDHSGILVLDPTTPVGLPLPQAVPYIEDTILEVSVTPNRGDCLSIIGIAREVAAFTGRQWRIPTVTLQEGNTSIRDRVRLDILNPELCPRYVMRVIEGIRVGPSPFLIRLRLHRSGMRPISNVVDATNYVLQECGQPLHAFDFHLLEDARILVRLCDPEEVFVTLDGVERKLPDHALMIRDGKRSVALAGIMGGINTEIREQTTTVLIESACFERFNIRRTAKALGIYTEASFRFERGVDPEGTLWAAHRVAQLIQNLAGGTVLSSYIDDYPQPILRPSVTVRPTKVNGLLGLSLEKSEMAAYLMRLGMNVKDFDGSDGSLSVTPPSWRYDIEREVDVAEEVARVCGFQNIPLSMPTAVAEPDRTREGLRRLRRVRELMNASGFTEIITMSFVSSGEARAFRMDGEHHGELALVNPLTEETAVMRTSLIPGLIMAMKNNRRFKAMNLKLYEVGKTFIPELGQELPREEMRLGGLAVGARYGEIWNLPRESLVDFYDVKGALETLFEGLDVSEVQWTPGTISFLHPGKSALLRVAGSTIGYGGEIAPTVARSWDIPGNVYIFEVLLEPLFVQSRKETVFKPISRYPYVERDLSFIIEEKCSGEKIKQLISRLPHDIIDSVVLFDIYRGESIPEGMQSMTFRIRYQSGDRTLTDEEVHTVHSSVAEALVRELGATMRE